MSGNFMYSPPGDYDDRDTARVNLELSESVRNAIDALCEDMIGATFQLVQSKLALDAEQIELYGLAGAPIYGAVPIFISPDLLEAPMEQDEPSPTLIVRLQRGDQGDGEDSLPGDTLRLFLPVSDTYEYPAPLTDDDLPPELYIEVSDTQDPTIRQRYIIQRDENDFAPQAGVPRSRYAVFEYDSAADPGGAQIIHGSLSDRMIFRSLESRIPINPEIAMRLIRGVANYDAVVQVEVDIDTPPSEEKTA